MIIHQFLKEDAFGDRLMREETVEGKGNFACVKYRDGWYNFYYYTETFQGWTLLRGVINHSEEDTIKEFERFLEDVSKEDSLEEYYEELAKMREERNAKSKQQR